MSKSEPNVYTPKSYAGVRDPATGLAYNPARDIGHAFTRVILRNAVIFLQEGIEKLYSSDAMEERLKCLQWEVVTLLDIWQRPMDKESVGAYMQMWGDFRKQMKKDKVQREVHSALCEVILDELLGYLLSTPYAAMGLTPVFGDAHCVLTRMLSRAGRPSRGFFRRLFGKREARSSDELAAEARSIAWECRGKSVSVPEKQTNE